MERFLFSPPDKAKYLKELSEQMPFDADIKRQQAPRSLKAEEAFRIFGILSSDIWDFSDFGFSLWLNQLRFSDFNYPKIIPLNKEF